MDKLVIIKEIIKEQSLIIGDALARNRAESTGVVQFRTNSISDIVLLDESEDSIAKIVFSFEEVFGAAAKHVCRNVMVRLGIGFDKEDALKSLFE